MQRRDFLKTTAALSALGANGLARAATERAPWANGTDWKAFEVTTSIEIPKTAGVTRAWVPLPLSLDTDYFRGMTSSWTGNASRARVVHDAAQGTALFYAEWDKPVESAHIEVASRFQTRDRAVNVAAAGKARGVERIDPARYLKPTALIPTDGIVRETSLGITRMHKTDVAKARAIYEWIVENTYRDGKVKGCGWGDIKAMLESGNLGGKCGDLNAMFVGLARASGIPARDVYGLRVAPSQWGYRSMSAANNVSRAQHCRAEFYTASLGWVPVDPADVRKVILEEPPGNLPVWHEKVKLAREKLFGAWEMNWMAFNYAHDVALPNGKGAPLPYLMYPNAEVNGERRDSLDPDSFKYTITSKAA